MYNQKSILSRLKIFLMFAFIPLFAFICVVILPFFMGIFMTFTNWNGISKTVKFIGLDNFVSAINGKTFWDSLLLTFIYVIISVVLTNVVAFGLALLVSSGFKGQNGFRMGFFTPNLIGGVILGFIWQFVFAKLLVMAGETYHIKILSESWLVDPVMAFVALIIVGVWQNSGYMMLIYIAGLTGISKSVLEAAEIDGASKMKQLLKIKIPLMIQAFTISLFLTIKGSFMVYDTNLSLTKGGPFRTTELITMHVYNEAFVFQNYGPAQAKALILCVIVAIIAVLQVTVMKKMEVSE